MIHILFGIIFFVLGASIGSFLQVIISRTKYTDKQLLSRSQCMNCSVTIRAIDLIPVVSYIWLNGSCRSCTASIPKYTFFLELITGSLFLLLYLFVYKTENIFVNANWNVYIQLFRDLVLISFGMLIFMYDYLYMRILPRFVIPPTIIALITNLFLGISFMSMSLGVLIVSGFFLLQFVLSRGTWIGGGDITLGLLIGTAFGAAGAFMSLLLAYLMGGFIAAYLLLKKYKQKNTKIAFGTFLIIGMFVTLLTDNALYYWYIGLLS